MLYNIRRKSTKCRKWVLIKYKVVNKICTIKSRIYKLLCFIITVYVLISWISKPNPAQYASILIPIESSTAPLIPVEGSYPDVDIIFVHGLEGHPNSTWFNSDSTQMFGDLLLLDKKLKHLRIRVHSYGYPNAMFKFEAAQPMNLEDRADDLLTHLWTTLGKSSKIVFVAHSMGGLVVKQAIVDSKRSYPNIFSRIHGAVFYATPHTGADLATWLKHIAKSYVSEAIINLTPSYLTKLNKQFNEILNNKQMYVLSLCERKPVLQLSWWDTSISVVPPYACTSFSAWEKLHPLQYDHSHICKPKSVRDIRYAVTRQYLIELNITSLTKPIKSDHHMHAQPQKYEMIFNKDKYCSHQYEYLYIRGMYYTGTNPLHYLINSNFDFSVSNKSQLLPNSANYKQDKLPWEWIKQRQIEPATRYLHIYTIKHPLTWFKDACNQPYDFIFDDDNWLTKVCPMHIAAHRVRKIHGDGMETVNKSWDSLVEYYNEWYLRPFKAVIKGFNYPFIVVKYEDILFKPEQLAKELSLCADVPLKDENNIQIDPLDEYMTRNDALDFYSKDFSAWYSSKDIAILKMIISNDLLKLFDYDL